MADIIGDAVEFIKNLLNPDAEKQIRENIAGTIKTVEKATRDLGAQVEILNEAELDAEDETKEHIANKALGLAKMQAQHIVKIRRQREQMIQLGACMKSVKLELSTFGAKISALKAMQQTTHAMQTMQVNLPTGSIAAVVNQFNQQMRALSVQTERFSEAMTQFSPDEGLQTEADDVLNQVIEEITNKMSQQMAIPASSSGSGSSGSSSGVHKANFQLALPPGYVPEFARQPVARS